MSEKNAVTVRDLVEYLSSMPQDMEVVYALYSEYCMVSSGAYVDGFLPLSRVVRERELCEAREDGWVHCYRSDKASKKYLAIGFCK